MYKEGSKKKVADRLSWCYNLHGQWGNLLLFLLFVDLWGALLTENIKS